MTVQDSVTTRPKVFLTSALADAELAREVTATLSKAGLEVTTTKARVGSTYSRQVRDALRDSSAVIVVLSDIVRRRDIPASVLFEIGAATGAGKPIYVLTQSLTSKLPFNVPELHILPLNRAEEIVRQLTIRP